MPTRIQIRHWLATSGRSEIVSRINRVESEHGQQSALDVKHFLNVERAQDKTGIVHGTNGPHAKHYVLESPAEASLLDSQSGAQTTINECRRMTA